MSPDRSHESEHQFDRAPRVLLGMRGGAERARVAAATVAGGFVVCAEFDHADAAVELLRERRPDVALLDVRLPGSGTVAARRLLEADPSVAVVLFGDAVSDDVLFDALDAGAAGVLPTGVDPERLPQILRGVLTGESALPRLTMTRVLREFSARARPDDLETAEPVLSPRQQEVLRLLAEQRTTSEIAQALFISKGTVRSHVLAILRRLDLPDRDALVEHFGRC
jgi:DNA-binding NarL/FixJ family response regulator